MSWKQQADKERETPKFLRAKTMITVDFSKEPIYHPKVAGKFGERPMYTIETVEYGLVFVSPIQLMHIADVAKGDFKGKMTVEL